MPISFKHMFIEKTDATIADFHSVWSPLIIVFSMKEIIFHLFLAALLWTTIGILLISRGIIFLTAGESLFYCVVAILLGTLKSLFILDKTAKKSIERIQLLADGSCLGAVYSVKTWGLVMIMMSMGFILRQSGIPVTILGILYITIGWALLFSSRSAWKIWCKFYFDGKS